jgi:hypothetical protein
MTIHATHQKLTSLFTERIFANPSGSKTSTHQQNSSHNSHRLKRNVLALLSTLCLFSLISLNCAPSQATPSQANYEGAVELTKSSDSLSAQGTSNSTKEDITQEDVTRRPLFYWRSWANQRLPFGRVLGMLLMVSLIINFFIEPKILQSGLLYRKKWLRCFGVGILFFTISLISAGVMSRMGLFAPLGALLVGTVQLIGFVGLTIGAHAIGDTTLKLTRLNDKLSKPWLKTLAKFSVGCLLLSLFVLMPGRGAFPRMGTRMLALVAAAGAGSFILAIRTKKSEIE